MSNYPGLNALSPPNHSTKIPIGFIHRTDLAPFLLLGAGKKTGPRKFPDADSEKAAITVTAGTPTARHFPTRAVIID